MRSQRWLLIQTDNPSLAGMLSQLYCDRDHPASRTMAEQGRAAVNLTATETYPLGLGKLMVLALMLRWEKQRDWIV